MTEIEQQILSYTRWGYREYMKQGIQQARKEWNWELAAYIRAYFKN